ncbi:hypothetical protein MP228_008811 [Amoeboaphelidium protococcarum]|nr:hypothetical protein MP228_008811 [Amoeboaphelidium protococcarum]
MLRQSLNRFGVISPSLCSMQRVTCGNYQWQQMKKMSVASKIDGNKVDVHFEGNVKSRFDAFWLRDHCKCEQCFHPTTKQRLVDTFSIPQDITAKSVSINANNVSVTWPDGHVSTYDIGWLKRHAYDPPTGADKLVQARTKILWDVKKIKAEPEPVTPYNQVMGSNDGLAQWLKNIDIYGFGYVSGVPVDPVKTEELARRIAFIRETHYGQFWDFTSNLAHGDTAYTNLAIGGHTDSTYFTDPIGLQLFHLLHHHGEGGKTLLVDGFRIANIIRDKHPQHFKTLTTFRIPTHSAGDESILIRPTPTVGYPLIQVDPTTKEVYQIRYNNHDRSVLSGQNYTAGQIKDFYAALKVWRDLVVHKDSEHWIKMQPGKAIIVDNYRVMHGRSGFTGKRRLSGAYINWDDYRSRLAMVLEKGKEKEDL